MKKMSSSEESVGQNVLYKVFVRSSSKNVPLDRNKLHHTLLSVVEPFKIYIQENKPYGFIYFGCRRDALACIGAFNDQPPYHYVMQMATPEVHIMTPKEIQKMNDILQLRARKLKQIEMQMRELQIEHSRIRCSLKGNGQFSDSEGSEFLSSDIFDDLSFEEESVQERSDNYRRSRSRSRLENDFTVTVKRGKSLERSRSLRQSTGDLNQYNNGTTNHQYSQQRSYDKSMDRGVDRQRNKNNIDLRNKNLPQGEYYNIAPNRPPRDSVGRPERNNGRRQSSNYPSQSNPEYNNRSTRSATGDQQTNWQNKRQSCVPSFEDNFNQEQLPNNEPVEVKVQCVDNDYEGWVILTKNTDKFHKLNLDIFNCLKTRTNDIYVGKLCAARHQRVWCRAKIINIAKSLITVQFIDYGPISTLTDVFDIPTRLFETPAQAIHIKFSQYSNCCLEFERILTVKAVGKERDIQIVQIIDFNESDGDFECDDNSWDQIDRNSESLRFSRSRQSNRNDNTTIKRSKTPVPSTRNNDLNKTPLTQDTGIGKMGNELNRTKINSSKSFDNNSDRKCIVNLLTSEHSGVLRLKTILNSNSCIAHCAVNDFLDQINIIQNIWESYSENDTIIPKVGDFICVEYDDGWSRGYVLSKAYDDSTWRVRLIDDGVDILASNVCQLLPEHINIPEFACKCEVKTIVIDEVKFKNYFLPNKTYGFTVKRIENNGDKVLCVLKDRKTKMDICEMYLSRWHSTTNDHESLDDFENDNNSNLNSNTSIACIPHPEIVSGCTVVISNVENPRTLFVRFKESSQNLPKINELMSAYGSRLPLLNEQLRVGQCIAAKYSEDGLWYRGEIKKLSPNNEMADVLYVDYGNTETVEIDDIRKLLEPMYEIPRVLVEVKLKGLPDSVLSVPQIKHLQKCVENKMKFKMIFDNLDSGVTLISINDNSNLNERLLQLNVSTISSPPIIESRPSATRKSISSVANDHMNSSTNEIGQLRPPSSSNSTKSRTTNERQRRASPTTSISSLLDVKINVNELQKCDTPVKIEKQSLDKAAESTFEKSSRNNESQIKSPPKESPSLALNSTTNDKKEDDEIFIKMEDLPLGKTELIFESIMDADDRILICYKNDLENLAYVQSQLTVDLYEYVEKMKPKPFVPSEGGPCIAKFEDAWYRAVCLKVESDSALVLFVDFGNYESVPLTDIRTLPQQFASAPGIALICTVKDVPSSITSAKFTSLLERGEIYDVEVLEKEEEGQYQIRMPHILRAAN